MSREYSPGELVPGTIYRVVRSIGEGGMGRVYEVEDTTLGKRYALKTLLLENSDALVRMAVESRTLVLVSHPNIVNVVTAGTTSDGCFYYVMELLRGASLRRILDEKRRIPARFCLPIALAVAQALERAHFKNVVHRDVKPENIFVAKQTGGASVIKLLDFGVAALRDNVRGMIKDSGVMLGSPRYASPEQLSGATASPSMDVWALGAVVFEMIVGRAPFEGAGALAEEMTRIVQPDLPVPPLSALVPDMAPELARLVAWMLEKNVEKRAPTMTAVIAELRAIPS